MGKMSPLSWQETSDYEWIRNLGHPEENAHAWLLPGTRRRKQNEAFWAQASLLWPPQSLLIPWLHSCAPWHFWSPNYWGLLRQGVLLFIWECSCRKQSLLTPGNESWKSEDGHCKHWLRELVGKKLCLRALTSMPDLSQCALAHNRETVPAPSAPVLLPLLGWRCYRKESGTIILKERTLQN